MRCHLKTNRKISFTPYSLFPLFKFTLLYKKNKKLYTLLVLMTEHDGVQQDMPYNNNSYKLIKCAALVVVETVPFHAYFPNKAVG